MNSPEPNIVIQRVMNKYLSSPEITEKLDILLRQRGISCITTNNKISPLKNIGSGSYGTVALVHYKDRLYAHKKCSGYTTERRCSVLNEAIRLTDIIEKHPNIQRLHFIDLCSLGFFMDYCHNGSLDQLIENRAHPYDLSDVLNWCYQLADAIGFLHAKHLMHRDVKVQNVLLKHDYQTVVLADFGTVTDIGRILLTNKAGSLVTMAPEVFETQTYNEKCDIYSWSIVLWQLLARNLHPYNIQSLEVFRELTTNKLRPHKFSNCPDILIALMYRTQHSVPCERPALPFIKKVLRLLYNALPNNRREYTPAVEEQLEQQWRRDYGMSQAYLPWPPRLHNLQSRNIHQDYLKKMKLIMIIKDKILDMKKQLSVIRSRNITKEKETERLVEENRRLEMECASLGICTNN